MIRLHNALVMPMTSDCSVFRGEVWTDGGRIAYAGAPRAGELPEFEREIDLNGDLVLPGFKNAHAHSAMTFLRSYADDLPLQSWLFDKVFPLEARLTPEAVYAFTRLAVLEYLSGGITASFDMYFHRDAYARANIDCGFRTVICGALSAGDKISVAADDYAKFNALDPLISYLPGVHAEYTADEKLLRGMSELVHELKSPFWTHNSETKSETDGCFERHGMSPTEYLDSLGLYDFGGGGYHCVWFSERDIEIFAEKGLWAVTCPCSNAKLSSGIAPLERFEKRGVRLAVGTDGPASNNALDMFREMYLACVLQKLRLNDAAACPAENILLAACSGGARAMGLDGCDSLAEGKAADLAVISLHRPNMRPIHDVAKNLVYSGTRDNVRMTMVAGRILYENGEFRVGCDAEEIYAEAEKYTKELIENEA
ncbi:MAG TPA: amidohydrolase [Candidatus Scatomorpha pullicola]|nr:amidohydrolase [Candidatus Scatomorpha pullicola]